ncbi:lactate utilization protein [bacterium]|nr:lactate utilization protein [bacterium]
MNNIKIRNKKLAEKIINNLQKRNFKAYFCENKQETIQKIEELISKTETISWGGSITLEETGIKNFLEENNYKTINRDKGKTKEEKEQIVRQGLISDVFLMSANAITEDGIIINIDGTGNRISALCFGPKRVIIIAGMNKIVKTVEDGLSRARNYAAPINAQRINNLIGINTPCTENGSCVNCKSETSICSQILTTRLSNPKGRITVILVNEELGY